MSTRKLVIVLTFLGVFAMAARLTIDTDTWWHLRAGAWILENRQIPTVDLFSFTEFGNSWRYPGWFVQIPMVLIYSGLGPGGLNLWTAVMVTLAFALVWRVMPGGVLLRAFLVVFGATVAAVYWAARPYLVSFLLTALFLHALESHRRGEKKAFWWLILGMILWVNSHGAFIVGYLLWGAYGADAGIRWLFARWKNLPAAPDLAVTVRQLLLIGATMTATAGINPHGYRILAYPFQTVSIDALGAVINEWQSPNFADANVWPFAAMLFAVIAAVGWSRVRLTLVEFLLVAGFGALSLYAQRNIASFGLVVPLVLARHLDDVFTHLSTDLGWGMQLFVRERVPRPLAIINVGLALLVVLTVLAKLTLVVPPQKNLAYFETVYPTGAVAYLQDSVPTGRMLNSYNWGGYLLWHVPDVPVFIDGRTDLYAGETINQWLTAVWAGDGWEQVLETWDIQVILLETGAPLLGELDRSQWEQVYVDTLAEIWVRR